MRRVVIDKWKEGIEGFITLLLPSLKGLNRYCLGSCHTTDIDMNCYVSLRGVKDLTEGTVG